TVPERQMLLAALHDYLAANAAHQNAPLNITAARADEVFTALKNARSHVNHGNNDLGQAKATIEAAEETLRTRMQGLIGELTQLLDDDDPLWYAFGLNRPADPEAPGIPDNLVLTPGMAGT